MVLFAVIGAAIGASNGLYDKFLMFDVVIFTWDPRQRKEQNSPFQWRWSIALVAIFLTTADFVCFYALSLPSAMVSIIGST